LPSGRNSTLFLGEQADVISNEITITDAGIAGISFLAMSYILSYNNYEQSSGKIKSYVFSKSFLMSFLFQWRHMIKKGATPTTISSY